MNQQLVSENLRNLIKVCPLEKVQVFNEDLILVVLGQKWVESIAIYKLLCLSGFSFPMISSISSTLKAMGNSRLFIKLEFTRKSIVVLGLIVGFSFGLNEYLISLIITGTINVLLTYIITCKSFKVGYVRHLFDVLIYGVIAIISVLIISNIPFGNIDNRVLKMLLLSLCYLSIVVLINTLLNTYSYTLVRKKIFEK